MSIDIEKPVRIFADDCRSCNAKVPMLVSILDEMFTSEAVELVTHDEDFFKERVLPKLLEMETMDAMLNFRDSLVEEVANETLRSFEVVCEGKSDGKCGASVVFISEEVDPLRFGLGTDDAVDGYQSETGSD